MIELDVLVRIAEALEETNRIYHIQLVREKEVDSRTEELVAMHKAIIAQQQDKDRSRHS